MFFENEFVGSTEYIITFSNGTFHVINGDDGREEISGHLVICKMYIEQKRTAYAENRF